MNIYRSESNRCAPLGFGALADRPEKAGLSALFVQMDGFFYFNRMALGWAQLK